MAAMPVRRPCDSSMWSKRSDSDSLAFSTSNAAQAAVAPLAWCKLQKRTGAQGAEHGVCMMSTPKPPWVSLITAHTGSDLVRSHCTSRRRAIITLESHDLSVSHTVSLNIYSLSSSLFSLSHLSLSLSLSFSLSLFLSLALSEVRLVS